MTPEQMRRAAALLVRNGMGRECFDFARLLREQAEAMGFRMLKPSDAYCPGCGHNRDKSSVSTITCADGMCQCQMCGAKWNELPPPPEGGK